MRGRVRAVKGRGERMGRKPMYKKRYAKEMCEYFARYVLDEDYDEEHVGHDGKPYRRHKGLPTFSKYAKKVGVTAHTLGRWAAEEDKPEFAEAYERCREMQKDILIDKGLDGSYNSKIVSLLLGSVYGLSDSKNGEEDGGNIYIVPEDPDFDAEGE